MGEFIDKSKGTAKEVVGAATGDRTLEAEGKADRAKGHLKGAFEQIKSGLRGVFGGKKSDGYEGY